MNGDEDSNKQSAKELAARVDRMLEEYECSLGIKNKNPHIAAEKYFELSHEEIMKMSGEQCHEGAVILAQFSFFLQRSINVELGRVNWCNNLIDRTICQAMKSYNSPTAMERKMLAIRENDFALSLEKLKNAAQSKSDRLNYLSSKVDGLSLRFADLGQAKLNREKKI